MTCLCGVTVDTNRGADKRLDGPIQIKRSRTQMSHVAKKNLENTKTKNKDPFHFRTHTNRSFAGRSLEGLAQIHGTHINES